MNHPFSIKSRFTVQALAFLSLLVSPPEGIQKIGSESLRYMLGQMRDSMDCDATYEPSDDKLDTWWRL